jgi:hypothetical protein
MPPVGRPAGEAPVQASPQAPSYAPTPPFPQQPPYASPSFTPASPGAPAGVPGAYPPPAFQPSYPPGYPAQPAAYAPAATGRSAAYYIGLALVLLCGVLVLVSSFMAWYGFSGLYMASGWDVMQGMREAGLNPFVNTANLGAGGDKLVFSGLCSLIAGILLALFALIAMPLRSRGMAALLLCLSLVALSMAGINAYSFLTLGEGVDLGAGMFLFLVGSAGGLVGSIVGLAG